MKAIAARDEIAVDPVVGSVLPVGHEGRIRVGTVDGDTSSLVHDQGARGVVGLVEITRDLGLAVDCHGFTGQRLEIDPEGSTGPTDARAAMHQPFARQPLADASVMQQIDSPLLQFTE